MNGEDLLIATLETAVPEATEAAEAVTKSAPFNWVAVIIAGVVIGLIVAIVLAVKKGNKLYGKGW